MDALCVRTWFGCAAALLAGAAMATEPARGIPFGRSDGPDELRLAVPMPRATDPDYGHTPAKPIRLGGGTPLENVRLFRRVLASLGGPQGQPVEFERMGPCCGFVTGDDRHPLGLLDQVRILPDGGLPAITLYFDIYTPGAPSVPVGLTQYGLPAVARIASIVNASSCMPTAADYPKASIANDESGTTRVSFTVGTDSRLKAFGVVRSSGSLRLDFTALLKLAGCTFVAATDAEGRPRESTFELEYIWRLE